MPLLSLAIAQRRQDGIHVVHIIREVVIFGLLKTNSLWWCVPSITTYDEMLLNP